MSPWVQTTPALLQLGCPRLAPLRPLRVHHLGLHGLAGLCVKYLLLKMFGTARSLPRYRRGREWVAAHRPLTHRDSAAPMLLPRFGTLACRWIWE
jgi:hypothetical protein